MKESSGFDERQLWIRGNVYKHALIFMGILLILNGFMKDSGIIITQYSLGEAMLIVLITTTFGSIEMICRDVYSALGKGKIIPVYLMGAISIISFVKVIYDISFAGELLILNKHLSSDGMEFVTSVCLIIICSVYFIKTLYNRNAEKEE